MALIKSTQVIIQYLFKEIFIKNPCLKCQMKNTSRQKGNFSKS